MPCDSPSCQHEFEHAILAERELRLAAEARADACELCADQRGTELAILRPLVSELRHALALAVHQLHPPVDPSKAETQPLERKPCG